MRRVALGILPALLLLALAGCSQDESPPPATGSTAARQPHPGERPYLEHCASCHEGGVYKAPHRMFLAMMAPDAILASLDGLMATQAAALSADEKRAVAEYLAGRPLSAGPPPEPAPACDDRDLDMRQPPAQRGWGIDLANTRFQPLDSGGLDLARASRLELRWAFAYPNAIQARSQPTVAGGAVFVGSQDGTVYALDARSGCIKWRFRASAEVRTPIVITPWTAGDEQARPRAYFGDILARAYALDARSGELLWQTKVDEHPNATITGAPVFVEQTLYVPVSSLEVVLGANPQYACCSFRGSLAALDAASGELKWKTYTIAEAAREVGKTSAGTAILAPSGAPIWNSPTVDLERRLLYAGTGENYSSPAGDTSDAIIAFDMDDGHIRWVAQATPGDAWNVGCLSDYTDDPANCPEENGPDFDFAAPPILVRLDDREVLVAGQKSGEVMGIDPDSGRFLWRRKLGRGGVQGGVHFGMAAAGRTVYVPINDMRYPEDETRYRFTEPPRPGLHAIDAATGESLWFTPADDICPATEPFCDPGISAAITAIPGGVIAGHLDGRLRVYAADDGRVAWEFATAREFDALNGQRGRGGSLSGGGPAVGLGMLFANSGYGIYQHMPGNLLLAFGPAD
ncbi:MAG: dehydrogenase [Gammaproteobacteria bacterium]|nr:MAG: dehydrogenase [Gammaproteobacteria bacterium]